MNIRRQLLATLSALSSAGLLIYLWIVLGDRGLNADATHTAGYTYPYEFFMGVAGLILLYLSLYLFIKKK